MEYLDNSKIMYHPKKIKELFAGKRPMPITIDMCLSNVCNYACEYCYGKLQKNPAQKITWEIAKAFLDDCKELGVKAISLVSDNESTCSPIWTDFIIYCKKLGIDVALGTNGYLLTREVLNKIIPKMTYLRFNISAGEPDRYAEIHGVTKDHFYRVEWNILDATEVKRSKKSDCQIGLQMVCMPKYKDDVIPLAKLAVKLKVDYFVIKHCSDDENGQLGVDYSKYKELEEVFKEAEKLSTKETRIVVKWNKIKDGNTRSYKQCYAPPLHLQISGSGLVAPCGFLFNSKYKQFHIGNFCETRFKDLLKSDKYWEVMDYLASDKFVSGRDCGFLCLQHLSNIVLDNIKKGKQKIKKPSSTIPGVNFI